METTRHTSEDKQPTWTLTGSPGRMRSLIAHHYDCVDDRLVFSTVARRTPELVRRLELGTR